MIKAPINPITMPDIVRFRTSAKLFEPSFRRRTLFDLSPMTHCSILGTCLTTAELRKVVRKVIGDRVQDAPDHEIHAHGVRLASVEGLPSKLLNKTLDDKHEAIVRRFSKAKTEEEIKYLWDEAKRSGHVEGPYWAVTTHPAAGEALFKKVFGDVHMLSHLVGASNRVDIRRLVEADAEIVTLREALETTQRSMRSSLSRRDQEIQQLKAALADQLSNSNTEFRLFKSQCIKCL